MAKKCTDKCDARGKLLFCLLNPLFFEVLAAIASLDLKLCNVSCKMRKLCHLTFWHSHHMETYARWKSKQLLSVVSLPSQGSVCPGETNALRVEWGQTLCIKNNLWIPEQTSLQYWKLQKEAKSKENWNCDTICTVPKHFANYCFFLIFVHESKNFDFF